jgi:hypothetical protein
MFFFLNLEFKRGSKYGKINFYLQEVNSENSSALEFQ